MAAAAAAEEAREAVGVGKGHEGEETLYPGHCG